ncbi:hypothetical protein V1517DRAFT_320904 [Lipomyces orientalis]|uniref:Uncharacterized protein n=1 Tax=Lipomyces orientalis TaxID=1233043 RepID=A0ACC3TQ82_9ASCO
MSIDNIVEERTQYLLSDDVPTRVQKLRFAGLVRLYTRQLVTGCGRRNDEEKCKTPFCASSVAFAAWMGDRTLAVHAAREIAWRLVALKGRKALCPGIVKEEHSLVQSSSDISEDSDMISDSEETVRSVGTRLSGRGRINDRIFVDPHNAIAKDTLHYGRALENLVSIDDLYLLRRASGEPQNRQFVTLSLVHIFSSAEKLTACVGAGPEMFRIVFRLLCDAYPDPDTFEYSEIVDALTIGLKGMLGKHLAWRREVEQTPEKVATVVEESSIMQLIRAAALASSILYRYARHVLFTSRATTTLMAASAAFHALYSPSNASVRTLFVQLAEILTIDDAVFLMFVITVGDQDADDTVAVLAHWAKAYIKLHWPQGNVTFVKRTSVVAKCIELWRATWKMSPAYVSVVDGMDEVGTLTHESYFADFDTCDRKTHVHILDYAQYVLSLKLRVELLRHRSLMSMIARYRHATTVPALINHVTRFYPSSSSRSLRANMQESGILAPPESPPTSHHPSTPTRMERPITSIRSLVNSATQHVAMQYALQRYVQLYFMLDVSRADLLGSVLSGVRAGLNANVLHKPLKVRFFGSGEDGVDHGGVQVELFASVGRKICDPDYGMFTIDSETQRAWFHQGCRDSVDRFEVVGATVGLAVYNGCTVSVSFPKMMYMMLLGETPSRPEDIEDIFPSLAAGLRSMLSDDFEIADLGLTFDYTYTTFDGTVTVPMRGDPSPAVTEANKKDYVAKYIEHLSYVTIAPFFDAFKRGWNKLMPDKITKLFRPVELMSLTQGQDAPDFDVGQLQRVTRYDDGYSPFHPAIEGFWQIVKSFAPEDRLKLLEFVTACPRVPIVDGISGVTFVIQRNGPDSDRLPTSLTCFGRLLLPEYSSKTKMEHMLRTAIEHSKGFGLV